MEHPLNVEESLSIISQAIENTKENMRVHSWSFIYWGSLVVLTSVLHFVLIKMGFPNKSWLVWPTIMILGYIPAILHYRKTERKQGFETQIDNFLKYLWMALGISFFITFGICVFHQVSPTPFMLILCAVGTFSSGAVLKYKPLIFGGIAFFLFAGLSLFVSGADNLLVNAAGIFAGFIIPGILLKNKK